MKTGVKKFLLVILMLILYLIAVTFLPSYSKLVKSSIDDNNSNRFENTNDIEDWNLPLNNLDYVYLNVKPKNSTTQGIILTNEEGIRLLNAFNAIQKNDIYWDQSPYTEALYGPLGIGIKVFYKNGEFISFIPNQAFMIYHNDAFYYTRYNLELFDEIRTLALTYDFEWLNLESELKTTNGLPVVGNYKDIVISPNTKVISTFSNIKFVED